MLDTSLNHWIKYYGKPNIVNSRSRWSLCEIKGFDVVLLPRVSVLSIDPGDASCTTGVLGKTLDATKQSAIRVTRRTPDSVTIPDIFDECTTAHSDLHRNRGFFPWQLLLRKTPTDKSVCENPDLAQ